MFSAFGWYVSAQLPASATMPVACCKLWNHYEVRPCCKKYVTGGWLWVYSQYSLPLPILSASYLQMKCSHSVSSLPGQVYVPFSIPFSTMMYCIPSRPISQHESFLLSVAFWETILSREHKSNEYKYRAFSFDKWIFQLLVSCIVFSYITYSYIRYSPFYVQKNIPCSSVFKKVVSLKFSDNMTYIGTLVLMSHSTLCMRSSKQLRICV